VPVAVEGVIVAVKVMATPKAEGFMELLSVTMAGVDTGGVEPGKVSLPMLFAAV
jgi:hypothetical protein